MEIESKVVLTDASRLIIEGLARAGADSFIGYPITPANLLYYYASKRFPFMMPAPDEITTMQWMSGLSASGRLPVTATSFPGFALMIESVNMAFMMELPMVIVLAQRLGPATGTATCGAQGDLSLLHGMISGGHQFPVICISDFYDAWTLAAEAVRTAVRLRTPVVLLTSKEMVMTHRSFNLSELENIKKVKVKGYNKEAPYKPYQPEKNLVPLFLHAGNDKHQVRITASTHDMSGILQHSTEEALANTIRLDKKSAENIEEFIHFDYFYEQKAETIVVTYGITAAAATEACEMADDEGIKVSLLVAKTLLPVPKLYYDFLSRYKRVVFCEENLNAQFARIIYGDRLPSHVSHVGAIGKMISPEDILKALK